MGEIYLRYDGKLSVSVDTSTQQDRNGPEHTRANEAGHLAQGVRSVQCVTPGTA